MNKLSSGTFGTEFRINLSKASEFLSFRIFRKIDIFISRPGQLFYEMFVVMFDYLNSNLVSKKTNYIQG